MLNTVEAVLVIIDVQGRLADIVDRATQVMIKILPMVKGCQALTVPILSTVQVPEKLGPISPELGEALVGEAPIAKEAFSAMREPDFLVALDQSSRNQILLCGIETHVCVLQTGMDLLDSGYEVHVLVDAVFSRTEENRQIALQRLHAAGATLTSVEMVLFELIRTSRHPNFRTISKLIK